MKASTKRKSNSAVELSEKEDQYINRKECLDQLAENKTIDHTLDLVEATQYQWLENIIGLIKTINE